MDFIKGADVSSLLEVEQCGGVFRDSGKEQDALVILRRYGFNWIRLRLWNDPYSEKGESYGGGLCDLVSVLALAQLGLVPPLIATVLYAFLSIRLEDASILDFLRYAMCFLFLKQQYFEWRENET